MNANDNILTTGETSALYYAFSEALVTLTFQSNYSTPDTTFNCQNSVAQMRRILLDYTRRNWRDTNNNGFLVSARKLINPPEEFITAGGITISDNVQPELKKSSYVFIEKLNDTVPSQYRGIAKIHVAIHELGHMRNISGHDGHSSDNYCCVMQASYPYPGFYNCIYYGNSQRFCKTHRCAINNNIFQKEMEEK